MGIIIIKRFSLDFFDLNTLTNFNLYCTNKKGRFTPSLFYAKFSIYDTIKG